MPSELRHALRSLVRTPGYTLAAATILALGLGLAIFMFTAVNSYILRPLPFPEPERLAHMELIRESDGIDAGVTLHDLLEFQAEQTGLESLAAYYRGTVNVGGGSHPARYDGAYITANTFEVLGARPQLGRDFLPSENGPGAQGVVILGHQLWRDRFRADPGCLGQTIRVNGSESVVVGVMPKGFAYPVREQVWVPAPLDPAAVGRGEGYGFAVIGRLARDVSLEQAETELRGIAARIAERYPDTDVGFTARLEPLAHEYVDQGARSMILTMFATALLVLAVACANVANLVLARNAARSRELAVRTALGASRRRVVFHVLGECLVVSVLGGVVAFGVARWAGQLTEAVIQTGGDFAPPYWVRLDLDWRSVAFAAGAAFLAAALAGLLPALRASRTDVAGALSRGGRSASLGPMGRLTRAFVVLQIAFSCVVLISAGLMARSVVALQEVEIGAETRGILTGRVGLFETDYADDADRIGFFERLVERLAVLPGVEWATASTSLPGVSANANWFLPQGYDLSDGASHPFAREVIAVPSYFDAFGIPVLEGRGLEESDGTDARHVVVVNRMLADRFWPGRSPLGQQLRMGRKHDTAPWRTVVGVVGDVVQDEVEDGVRPTIYLPLAQRAVRFMSVALRARGGDPMLLAEPMRKAVLELDRDLPVYWVRTLDEAIDLNRFGTRFIAAIFALAAVAGLALGAVGQYAVLAYTVSRRSREIGVRRALGAVDREVIALLLRQGAGQLAAGLLLGLILSLGFTRLLADALSGVRAHDPLTYLAVTASLTAAAVLASLIPARRALGVDPAVTLRCE